MQRYGKMMLVPFGEKVPFVETNFRSSAILIKWQLQFQVGMWGKKQVVEKMNDVTVGGINRIE